MAMVITQGESRLLKKGVCMGAFLLKVLRILYF